MLAGGLGRFEREHRASDDGGGHVIVVGRIRRVVLGEGEPKVFRRGAAAALAA